MNAPPTIERKPSVCPHDCPSACALDVEVIDGKTIGRVHGAKDQTYTAGVVCAKVARYAERLYHPDRLLYPMRRTGAKGSGAFERITWDEAFDEIARRFLEAERDFGAQSVWLNYYAGTMGKVMRDGVNRLAHAKKYSRHNGTICINLAWPGFLAGTGLMAGPDPREMAKADCVVIWGTNAVSTQVNVMTHASRARKERGAKIVVIDIYQNGTMAQADMALIEASIETDKVKLTGLQSEIDRLNRDIQALLRQPEVVQRLAALGSIADSGMGTAAFATFMKAERERWAGIVKSIGIKAE